MLWVAVLAGLGITTAAVGSAYSNSFSLPGTESTKALDLLTASSPAAAGDSDTIVVHTPTGSVTDPAVRAKVAAMLAAVAKLPEVAAVASPYGPRGAAQVSRDGRTAFAGVTFTLEAQELATADVQRVIDTGSAIRGPDLQVAFGGNAIESLSGAPTSNSEGIGLVAAAVILLIAFGSLLSMVIPLIAAVFAVGGATLAIGLLSHVLSISMIAPTIGALVGLGVGIDYALFIVTRHRNGLKAGLTPEESAVTALDTSGRAVVFAGGTVVIAMLGLLLLGLRFFDGVGIAAAIVVVFAVVVAVTLLPAIFGIFGLRVLSRRERRRLAETGPVDVDAGSAFARWAARVQRRPAVFAVAATLVMAVLVVPFFSLRLGSSDAGNDPASSTTRQAYDLLADGFGPGSNGPLLLVAEAPTAADQAALTRLVTTLGAEAGVASVAAAPAVPGVALRTVVVTPTTSPQSVQTDDLINRLRGRVIPAAEQGTTLQVYVGGQTAIFKDFAGVISGKLPFFIAVIVVLGCLLLMLAFRSVVIPLTAAVMNLLSAGAAFGIVISIFQWGWGSDALGLGKAGPVEAFLPVLMLAILFGLSMDYQVFLVSRMHEEWTRTGDNHRAVNIGQAATGRVITAAATIMVCVFLAFVFGGQRVIAEFGLGLASAILLDALVLRTVLVPAVMHLFGRANWWLPGWLDRVLPHVSVEPAAAAVEHVVVGGVVDEPAGVEPAAVAPPRHRAPGPARTPDGEDLRDDPRVGTPEPVGRS